jgi:hypothetical protein
VADATDLIKGRLFRLLKNILILYFILTFFRVIHPMLDPIIKIRAGGFVITSGLVFGVLSLISIIYFGYFILIDTKYFLDIVNKFVLVKLGIEGSGIVKGIAYDIAIIISLILASDLLTAIVVYIPNIGVYLARGINIIFIGIGFLLVYHITNEVYHLVKKQLDKLIGEVLTQVERRHEGRKGGGGR